MIIIDVFISIFVAIFQLFYNQFLCVFYFISFEKGIKLTGTNLEINSE